MDMQSHYIDSFVNNFNKIIGFITKLYVDHSYPFQIAIIALVVLVGIKVISMLKNKKKFIKKYAKTKNLNSFSWQEFEHFVCEYFKLQGYSVQASGGARADGGIDCIIRKRKTKKIVQVKRYKGKVSVSIVREMLGVYRSERDAMNLTGVVVVASSSFTGPAVEFAKKNDVELVDSTKISKLIEERK